MNNLKKLLSLILYLLLVMSPVMLIAQTKNNPIKVGVVGLTHTHVHWILGRPDRGDIKIVGIVEPNKQLAERYAKQHGFSVDLVFSTMEEMVAHTKPDAVTAFGTIYDHLKVVEFCAPRGIHIMVEKPLAVSMEHARKMKALAEKHNVHLLTNYETTWYATNHKAYDMLHRGDLGVLRKVVVHDGHQGPMEIGVNKEFLEWLTDPVANGGGALTDFGCYGANLITWLTKGQRPSAVVAVTQSFKPDVYPKVEDEATIILEYPGMQAIIQASWNWPVSRKDMEVYGSMGFVISENRSDLRFQLNEKGDVHHEKLTNRPAPFDDPFALLAAVIKKEITLPSYDLSSLENNMLVVEILDAARKSARTGLRVKLVKQ